MKTLVFLQRKFQMALIDLLLYSILLPDLERAQERD